MPASNIHFIKHSFAVSGLQENSIFAFIGLLHFLPVFDNIHIL